MADSSSFEEWRKRNAEAVWKSNGADLRLAYVAGRDEGMRLAAAPAVPAVDALTVEPTGYQVREIGEGDNWRDVSKETYDRYSMSPMWDTRMIIDTSTAPVAQTSDALQLRCEQDKFSAWSLNNLPKQGRPAAAEQPIKMILHCPKCGLQHIDAPETHEVLTESGLAEVPDWTNPPHRSHLCHGCSHIWRPADVPTEGVRAIETRGKGDSPALEQEKPDAWKKFGEDTQIIPYKLVDVVLDNGVTLERQKDRLVDWTAVSDWRYSDIQVQPQTSEQDDELPISMSTYGSLAACEAERARRGEQMGGAQVATLTCPKCGVDRLEEPCPGMADECAMVADAHLLANSGAAEGEATSEPTDPKVTYVRELVQSGEFMKLVAKWSTCSILEKDAAWAEVLRYTREVTHRQHVRSYNAGLAAATSERKPLTDAESADLYERATSYPLADDDVAGVRAFVQAIEQHHGIPGGGKNGA